MTSETDSAIDLAALKRVRESRAEIEKRNDARGRSAGLHWHGSPFLHRKP